VKYLLYINVYTEFRGLGTAACKMAGEFPHHSHTAHRLSLFLSLSVLESYPREAELRFRSRHSRERFWNSPNPPPPRRAGSLSAWPGEGRGGGWGRKKKETARRTLEPAGLSGRLLFSIARHAVCFANNGAVVFRRTAPPFEFDREKYRRSSRRRIVTRFTSMPGWNGGGGIGERSAAFIALVSDGGESFFRWRTLSTVPLLATANLRCACASRM